MQLVLDDKGRQLTRGQRALRAYLNMETPPRGFKGNPFVDGGKKPIERDLTHFHLSRYAYVRSVLEGALNACFELERNPEGDARSIRIPPPPISKEGVLEAQNYVKGILEFDGKQNDGKTIANIFPTFKFPLIEPDDGMIASAYSYYLIMVTSSND